jgi:hypothetical protein
MSEIVTSDQDRRSGEGGVVEHAAAILAQRFESMLAKPGPQDRLQIGRRNYEVRVDILEAQGIGAALYMGDTAHPTSSLTSVK